MQKIFKFAGKKEQCRRFNSSTEGITGGETPRKATAPFTSLLAGNRWSFRGKRIFQPSRSVFPEFKWLLLSERSMAEASPENRFFSFKDPKAKAGSHGCPSVTLGFRSVWCRVPRAGLRQPVLRIGFAASALGRCLFVPGKRLRGAGLCRSGGDNELPRGR